MFTGTYTATFTYINPGDRDTGATVADMVIRRGSGCSGSGGARTCASWAATTLNGTPSVTQASASGISLVSGASEADFAIGEPTGGFSREKQFIYTRETY